VRREELAEQGGPAGEGVAALADARLDGQAQQAGLANGPADLDGQAADIVAQGAAPSREVLSGHRPYCGGRSGMVSARRWRQKSISVGGRPPVTSATRSCGRMLGVRLAKERKGSPRRIDAAVAAAMTHDRAAALAGATQDGIYI
jgi:hypothetical protein